MDTASMQHTYFATHIYVMVVCFFCRRFLNHSRYAQNYSPKLTKLLIGWLLPCVYQATSRHELPQEFLGNGPQQPNRHLDILPNPRTRKIEKSKSRNSSSHSLRVLSVTMLCSTHLQGPPLFPALLAAQCTLAGKVLTLLGRLMRPV